MPLGSLLDDMAGVGYILLFISISFENAHVENGAAGRLLLQ